MLEIFKSIVNFLKNLSFVQKIIIFSTFLLLFLSLLFYITTTIKSRSNKTPVKIMYAPFVANITINGHSVKNNSTTYLKPGNYHLIAKLDHYHSVTENIKINNQSKQQFILGRLSPSDQIGRELENKYQSDIAQVSSIASREAIERGKATRKKYPITTILPIDKTIYKIDYELVKGEKLPTILIDTELPYVPDALKKLYSYSKKVPNISAHPIVMSSDFEDIFSNEEPLTSSAEDPVEFLKQSYPNQIDSSFVFTTKLDKKYALITLSKLEGSLYSTFRVILEKKDNSWQIISWPYPIVSYDNYPKVPQKLIKKLNLTNPSLKLKP